MRRKQLIMSAGLAGAVLWGASSWGSPSGPGLRAVGELAADGATAKAVAEETDFGRGLLESWQAAGVELPMPEEEILKLRPGTRRLKQAERVPGDERLRFTGFLHYSNVGGKIRLPYGFYTFDTCDGLKRKVFQKVGGCINGGGAYVGDRLYGMTNIQFDKDGGVDMSHWGYYEWDTDTWIETAPCGGGKYDLIMSSCDLDPMTGEVYGVSRSSMGATFNLIDYTEGTAQALFTLPLNAAAMAIANDGTAYLLDAEASLYAVNLTDGTYSEIGKLDFIFYAALQSMTFDRQTGKLYLAASEGDFEEGTMYGRLCEVNVTDASTRLIGYFPDAEEYTVLHLLYTPDDAAPGSINDLHVTYNDASLQGELTFTMPSATFGGTALNGEVEYAVYMNDSTEPCVTGSTAAGERVNAQVEPVEGRTKFVVVLSNECGQGERNAVESWGGQDDPATNNLAAVYDEDSRRVTLSWDNSNVGEHGGWADMEGVSYSVFRFPGPTFLADGVTAGTYSDDLSETPYGAFRYAVVPVKQGRYYTQVKTGMICGGVARELPWESNLTDENACYDFEIIDANDDEKTWEFLNNWNGLGTVFCNNNYYHASDDWLLTPALQMQEGMTYNILFGAAGMNSYDEMLEVGVGESASVSSYELILEPTVINWPLSGGVKAYNLSYICRKSGAYHIGFHGISPANLSAVVLTDIHVETGYPVGAPREVEEMKVKAAEGGELSATISFRAPVLDMGGNPLSAMRVDLYRGENLEPAGTLTDVEPGCVYEMTDPDAMNGSVLYTIVATNDEGAGKPAQASAFIGMDIPVSPSSLTLRDNLDGSVTLNWNAPEAGVNGGWVDQDETIYTLYMLKDGMPVKVAEDLDDTTATISGFPSEGNQGIAFIFVSAMNDVGESILAEFPAFFYGKSLAIPFTESFSPLAAIWRPETSNCKWNIYNGVSNDGDNVCMGMKAIDYNAYGVLTSGKVALKGVDDPKLVFTFYGYPGEDASIEVGMRVENGVEEKLLEIDFNSLEGPQGLRTVMVDMPERVTDKEFICLVFRVKVADCDAVPVVLLDDINLRSVPEHNLELSMNAQSKGTAGEALSVDLTVFNVGTSVETGCSLDVYLNGKKCKEVYGGEVYPFDRTRVNVQVPSSVLDAGEIEMRVELSHPDDMIDNDNVCTANAYVIEPLLEKVAELTSETVAGDVRLSWSAPVQGQPVTDSFEGYAPFAYGDFGQWKTVDADGMTPSVVLSQISYPGVNDAAAFFVADFTTLGYSETTVGDFTGHTGNGFVTCVRPSSLQNDDWLISPELSGDAQTLSFWAQTQGAWMAETFEVLWSDGGVEVSGFTSLGTYSPSGSYEEYTVELPAGARRFALHCTSFMGGMLMIDDVTYVPAVLELSGYNIYRDGELVATVAADVNEWSETLHGDHEYTVTALYGVAESGAESTAVSGVTGVSQGVPCVSVLNGLVKIDNCTETKVVVTTLDGMTLHNSLHNGNVEIPVAPGAYLVTVDSRTFKVMVK